VNLKRWQCRAGVVVASIAALLAQRAPAAGASGESVVIEGVPHVQQKPDFCGEACAEMFLRKLGKKISQGDVFDRAGLDPMLARGCYTADLDRSLTSIGFKTGTVTGKVATDKAEAGMEQQWTALHADLLKGVPSIVCMRTSDDSGAGEHFRLVLGYDSRSDEVIYHEPAEDGGAYRHMKRGEFLGLWPLKYSAKEWTVIRLRLEADGIRDVAPAAGFTDADYAQHMMQLRKKVPKEGFAIVLQRPFVVVGDESPEMVKRRAEQTVKWACDMLKHDYFAKDPAEIRDIWLFKDKASYEKHTREIFGDRPTTPFGYCSHDALIMNIATGGGTLVHEIVHAFMGSNFPDCPSWFNEGLASLYEQCGEKDGHISGYTNWRLAGLQKALKDGKAPSFKALTHTTTAEFYNEDSGTNYAQARYLCYYLQEKGLLRKFYQDWTRNCREDPTGYETLKKVLDEKDMDAFQKKWEAFVRELRFP